MPKLLICSRQSDEYQQLIAAANLTGLEIVTAPDPDCELIFGEPNLIRDVLVQLPRLKWVQASWAGVEPLLDPALRHDYILTNARGVFGGLMSEFVFGYLLLHERKILQRLEAQKLSKWDATLPGSLRGKTIGLLGVGSIGAELAKTSRFFGMKVYGFTRASETCAQVDRYFHGAASAQEQADTLQSFAKELDYLVSVLPNTAETRKIISAEVLAALPRQALFINVGRGSAVDESALIKALETGALAGAVLDVFEQEPLPAAHPLWKTPNTFITSHTSAPSFPADLAAVFIENYRLFAAGQAPKYQVDFERGY
ncbi:MAG: D-2-hydroxyacid dehydrogenase [Chloroflexi bacterium]|nr:D-2-hydroxyacid dehydrogenase [Chloroflexota bacterium]